MSSELHPSCLPIKQVLRGKRERDYRQEPIKMQKHQVAELGLQGCPVLAFPDF